MSDEELEDDGSLRLRRLPLVSCSAAKALVCVTGAVAVGAQAEIVTLILNMPERLNRHLRARTFVAVTCVYLACFALRSRSRAP